MRTEIHPALADRAEVKRADAILRRCVHCGFCNATCPTYQELGEELDGPRGRIYLIKNLLEDNHMPAEAVTHLDRCLTCRACETTCPSGVQYGELIDIGRGMADQYADRPRWRRFLATSLRYMVPRRWLFHPLLKVGQLFRGLLPAGLRAHVPAPVRKRARTDLPVIDSPDADVLLLTGCVQSVATPNVVSALQALLNLAGLKTRTIDEGCCGALDYHLSAHETGKARMKRVIELLEPQLDQVQAIVSSATGCGVTLTDYPKIFQDDHEWHERAARVAAKIQDAVTLVESHLEQLESSFETSTPKRIAVHTPCSMQHGMQLVGRVEAVLSRLGYELTSHAEGHLCCGSAGSYSILEPAISADLRARKLKQLQSDQPDVIVTANIGCQLHLGSEATVPVMHWLELVADESRR